MEYAQPIHDPNTIRHVGYRGTSECIDRYYSRETVRMISRKVTELTRGVDIQNRPIVVPEERIRNVMDDIYISYRPPVGDIHTRYIIPSGTGSESYVQSMIDQVIEVITSDIRNNLEMEQYNSTLSKWTTMYGDFNEHGLRQHAPIKVRHKRPSPLQFNMNY